MGLRTHFLNVGDGDCTLIELPDGKFMVVDIRNARSDDSANGDFVNPIRYFSAMRIQSIFRYVQTHPDMDHMDGLADLKTSFELANFWDVENTKQIQDFQMGYREVDWAAYQRERKRAKHYYRGDLASPATGGEFVYSLFVANPTREIASQANESEKWNDMSYILVLEYEGFKLLLGGDAGDSIWQDLYEATLNDKRLRQHLTGVTVFKVSHHGLDSSYCGPDMLALANPQKLVISAKEPTGEDSAYNKYYSWMKDNGKDPTKSLFTTSKGNIIASSDDDPNGRYDIAYA